MAMRKFTELHSGERMGALCAPKFLLVPPDLEITALQILASEYDYSYAVAKAPAAPANVHTAGYDLQTRMNFAGQRVIDTLFPIAKGGSAITELASDGIPQWPNRTMSST